MKKKTPARKLTDLEKIVANEIIKRLDKYKSKYKSIAIDIDKEINNIIADLEIQPTEDEWMNDLLMTVGYSIDIIRIRKHVLKKI
jgi:hypothetical protein